MSPPDPHFMPHAAGEPSSGSAGHVRRRRVLIVDDDPNDVEFLERGLVRAGAEVDVVRGGPEALDFLFGDDASAHLPSLVLLDLKLPGMGGLEVLTRIKADPATRRIPVIVLASRDSPEIGEAYARGANGCVAKPANLSGFDRAMQLIAAYWLTLNEPAIATETRH
jgi:CheY-like chemotaxis protein